MCAVRAERAGRTKKGRLYSCSSSRLVPERVACDCSGPLDSIPDFDPRRNGFCVGCCAVNSDHTSDVALE
eukprot:798575-Amphidinium_carterae.1